MLKLKNLIFIFVCLFVFEIFLMGIVYEPTMEELTNPKSPSYVPIPYPQTLDEMVIDLKYAIKKMYRIGEPLSSNKSDMSFDLDSGTGKQIKKIETDWVLNKGRLSIKYFVRFKLMDATEEYSNRIMLDLVNDFDEIKVRYSMRDLGLLGSMVYGLDKPIPKMMSEEQAKDILQKNIGFLPNDINASRDAYTNYKIKLSGFVPIWKFIVDGKNYFVTQNSDVFILKTTELLGKGKAMLSQMNEKKITKGDNEFLVISNLKKLMVWEKLTL